MVFIERTLDAFSQFQNQVERLGELIDFQGWERLTFCLWVNFILMDVKFCCQVIMLYNHSLSILILAFLSLWCWPQIYHVSNRLVRFRDQRRLWVVIYKHSLYIVLPEIRWEAKIRKAPGATFFDLPFIDFKNAYWESSEPLGMAPRFYNIMSMPCHPTCNLYIKPSTQEWLFQLLRASQ